MKVAMSWFQDYVDIADITPKDYADALTMSGTMVEGIENLGMELDHVVTGRLTSVRKHENADTLSVCMVDIGSETLQIITGADNIKEGDIVPVALHGAHLAGGVKIKRGKLRGLESNGMLCSHDELGLSVSDLGYEPEYGILILDPKTPIGVDIKTIFGMNENVIEFEITSNRPDCQSVIGLARETAVTFGRPFTYNQPHAPGNSENVADTVKVDVLDQTYCPRYCARMVKNVKIGPSPEWMVRRLKASGIRSINNIVDITNYILLEYGQPMHAFDLRDLTGKHIIVRRARDAEAITTLDDVDRTLDSSMLVIADEARAVAVAGVMGAQNSEVKDDTTCVLFESANFDGASVRVTAKKLGLRTEASAKYEKGLDPYQCDAAVTRACELVEQLGCGEVVGGMIDVHGKLPACRTLPLNPERINAFLGAQISKEFMVDTLRALEFTVDTEKMLVTVPTWRADVEAEADLAEEILRIYGYNSIDSTLLSGEITAGGRNYVQQTESTIRQTLAALGLYETMTYSFTNPANLDKLLLPADSDRRTVVRIANPLGEETSVMRTTSLGSMLEVLSRNFKQRNKSAHLFEIAKIYLPQQSEQLPDERNVISLGIYPEAAVSAADFYTLKGYIEELFDKLGVVDVSFSPAKTNPSFHPGRCAEVFVHGKSVGFFGQAHPRVSAAFDLDNGCLLAELDIALILEGAVEAKTYRSLPKYPAVSRDLALILDMDVLAGDVYQIIVKNGGKLIDHVELFDIYTGAQIPAGKKSLAYAITFRAPDRTLTDDEISAVMDKILKALEKQTGAVLR